MPPSYSDFARGPAHTHTHIEERNHRCIKREPMMVMHRSLTPNQQKKNNIGARVERKNRQSENFPLLLCNFLCVTLYTVQNRLEYYLLLWQENKS